MINRSLDESVFPSTLKTAIVTPVHKSGDRQEVSNYRPISILPAISKVIEKVLAEQLVAHLNIENLLHPMQFGFRANHSTETACCYFLEVIKGSLDKGGVVGAVFLDLRKAFDTVNHSVLISKLSKFKLSVNVVNWIQSYLLGRSQCVRINDKMSSLKACVMGVPQGSILGPLLFSAYINDLPSMCDDVGTLMYADDTVLYACGKDPEQVAAKLSLAMEQVIEWLRYSCLTLNTDKTVVMYFVNKHKNMVFPNIIVGGQMIKKVDEFKYLGVTLDHNLTFKSHIKKMCHKVKYNIANFRHIRNSLTVEASKMYLNAMIFSCFHYCISCWSQANKTVLKPIRSLHKQALKTLDRKPQQYHHCDILDKY
uniref:Reverse transcriptase domain-containing protein n=1 Tax=Labrus bergylta TaxID=56723 RepID=A0A3Q3LKN7_9LABR